MKFRIFTSALIFFAIASCEEKKPAQQLILPEIIINEITASYDNCTVDSINCTYVHIEYPEFSDSTKTQLNEIISSKLKIIALSYFGEEAIHDTFEHIAQSFIRDYEAFKIDFPEYQFGWYVKLFSEITYESEKVISVKIESESYTGGAHPNSSTALFIIDKSSYQELSTSDIISDTTTFKKLLETEFRKVKGMSQGQSFADKGFYLNDGDFLLNNNIGLTDHSVLVHFNPYEIAPYSLGVTTLELEMSTLGDLLKVN